MLHSPLNLMYSEKYTYYKAPDFSIVSSLLFTLPAFKNAHRTGEDNTRRQHATAVFGLDVRVWHRFLSSYLRPDILYGQHGLPSCACISSGFPRGKSTQRKDDLNAVTRLRTLEWLK
jgi:hypothetical protein